MVEIAAHLVDHVIPAVPVRQWVVSLPKRVRDFLHRDPTLAAMALVSMSALGHETVIRSKTRSSSIVAEPGS